MRSVGGPRRISFLASKELTIPVGVAIAGGVAATADRARRILGSVRNWGQ